MRLSLLASIVRINHDPFYTPGINLDRDFWLDWHRTFFVLHYYPLNLRQDLYTLTETKGFTAFLAQDEVTPEFPFPLSNEELGECGHSQAHGRCVSRRTKF